MTPRSTKVHHVGTLILTILEEFYHHCPTSITILVEYLQIITAGRTPRQKPGQDWILTKQVACILIMHLRDMECEDLLRTGPRTTEVLTTFVQTHLISNDQHLMKRKVSEAWTEVKVTLTVLLYDIIEELLRIQNRHDALQQGNLLIVIADSVRDNMQYDAITIQAFSILSKLKGVRDISPMDAVILNVLRARWNMKCLTV
jgi:hypothetical protein